MADELNNLLGIAEIAGVFVGFAALVTIIARRSGDESRSDDLFKLANVVIINVMIIAAALLPLALDPYGLAPSVVWRISSGFLYILNLLQVVFLNRATEGYATTFSRRRVMGLAVLSLSPFFHVPLLLCIFGAMQHLAPAFFFTAIVVAVFQGILLFADLVLSMIAPASR